METTSFYQERIFMGLFCILNKPEDTIKRLREFVYNLSENHFTGKNKIFFTVIYRYFHLTGFMITPNDFMDAVKSSDTGNMALTMEYQELLTRYCFGEIPVDMQPTGQKAFIQNSEFYYTIHRLKEQAQVDSFGTILADSMQILVNGMTVKGKTIKGYKEARNYFALNLVEAEKLGGMDLPAGDVQDEKEDIMQEYAKAKTGQTSTYRVFTGIREVDTLTGGGMPGEMWFIAAYTGECKTTQCINMTYNAMLAGQNTLFCTAETLRTQVRRRLVARHSSHPKFNYPRGLGADVLKKGQLTEQEEAIFQNVVDDLTNNKEYGRYKIVQIPKKCTVDYYTGLLAKYEHEFYIHVTVWDEVRLAGVLSQRQSRREELNDIITEAKQMTVNHRHLDGSVGTLLLAPYQISRANWVEAVNTGKYTKACMAETSEAEKTADLILSQLFMQGNDREIKAQILKYRDGNDRLPEFLLDWQSNVCKITSKEDVNSDLLEG